MTLHRFARTSAALLALWGTACSTPTPPNTSAGPAARDTVLAPAAPLAAPDPAIASLDTVALPLAQRQAAFRALRAATTRAAQTWQPPGPDAPPEDWVAARNQRSRLEAATWGALADSLGLGLDALEGIWSEGVTRGWD